MSDFNKKVGLVGLTGFSNFSLLDGFRFPTGSTTTSDTTLTSPSVTATNTSGMSPADKLSALQNERTGLQQLIQACNVRLAEISAARGGCKRTFGWDNGCLSNNSAQSEAERQKIAAYEARIASIDAEIPLIQAEIANQQAVEKARLEQEALAAKAAAEAHATKLAAEAALLEAEAKANPETAQIQANAEIAKLQATQAAAALVTTTTLENKAEQNKLMMYIGAGVVALVIIAGVVMYIFKK